MGLFGAQRYKEVWNSYASELIREISDEDNFLAHITMGRAQLGSYTQSDIVNVELFSHDQASGYQGRIYSVTFKNTYPIGIVYDRIVVVKDPDGRFRLAGFWAVPAPHQ